MVEKRVSSTQLSLPWLLVATLLPAALVMLQEAAWLATVQTPSNLETIGSRLGQAAILLASMFVFWRWMPHRASSEANELLPYRRAWPWPWMIAAFVIASAWAIGLRDYVEFPFLGALVETLQPLFEGWPPAWLDGPSGFYEMPSDVGRTGRIAFLAGLIAAYGAVSAMQTLYFRGFLLPRMDRLGWWAVIANTALFSIYHIGSPAFWPYFFVWTLMWGVVTYVLRNPWPAVLSHLVFNTYGFALMIFELL